MMTRFPIFRFIFWSVLLSCSAASGAYASNARTFASAELRALFSSFPLQIADSLVNDSRCRTVAPDYELFTAPIDQAEEDAAANYAQIQQRLQCLALPSVRVVDMALGRLIGKSPSLSEANRTNLVHGIANVTLLVIDQLLHTGHSWSIISIKWNKQQLISAIGGNTSSVWLFNRGRNSMVQVPGSLCPPLKQCKGTLVSLITALGDPRLLGMGHCSLETFLHNGMRCDAGINCSNNQSDLQGIEGLASATSGGQNVFELDPAKLMSSDFNDLSTHHHLLGVRTHLAVLDMGSHPPSVFCARVEYLPAAAVVQQ